MEPTQKDILHLNFAQLTQQSFLQQTAQWLNEVGGCQWKKDIVNFLIDWFSDKETMQVTTSGSTGKPKSIALKKKYMEASARATLDFFKLKPNDRAMLCLPEKFIAGKMMLVRAVIGKLDLYCIEPTSKPISDLPQINFAAMTPAQMAVLLESEKGIGFLNNIQKLIVGGSFIPSDLEKSMQQLQSAIWHTYGMTETITHIALRKVNGEGASEWFRPLPGVELQLEDNDCLQIDAPKIGVHSLLTNDRAEISNKGFRILGRIDHVVNSGGIKLFPESIEKKIETYLDTPFFLCGVDHEQFGQVLGMVLQKSVSFRCKEDILTILETKLTGLEIPKHIKFVEEIEYSPNGKIVRKW